MARCWTCGAPVEGYWFSCNSCKHLVSDEHTRASISLAAGGAVSQLRAVESTIAQGVDRVVEGLGNIDQRLSQLAFAVEWGFDSLLWQVQRQSETLQEISRTLKTPTATQADEWRLIADQLATRGVHDQAQGFYRKALDAHPLDYRTYIGLAASLLMTGQFREARRILEGSIPHAPKEAAFDWRTHSYRLLGHISFCDENYDDASRQLLLAVKLSPRSAEAHFDRAVCCAYIGDPESVEQSLTLAISLAPENWHRAAQIADLSQDRLVVERVRMQFLAQGRQRLRSCIGVAEAALAAAEHAIGQAKRTNSSLRALQPSDPTLAPLPEPLASEDSLTKCQSILTTCRSNDYVDYTALVEAQAGLESATADAGSAEKSATADNERIAERLHKARYQLSIKRIDQATSFLILYFSYLLPITSWIAAALVVSAQAVQEIKLSWGLIVLFIPVLNWLIYLIAAFTGPPNERPISWAALVLMSIAGLAFYGWLRRRAHRAA